MASYFKKKRKKKRKKEEGHIAITVTSLCEKKVKIV